MNYVVKLKGTDESVVIRATSELEARLKYCQRNGFNYTLIAPKIAIERQKKKKQENSYLTERAI